MNEYCLGCQTDTPCLEGWECVTCGNKDILCSDNYCIRCGERLLPLTNIMAVSALR